MESYNPKYPFEFYETGKVYAFYGRYFQSAVLASAEMIDKYAAALEACGASDAAPVGFGIRYAGVVVGKDSQNRHMYVMFKNIKAGNTEYLINEYRPESAQPYFPTSFDQMPIASAILCVQSNGLFDSNIPLTKGKETTLVLDKGKGGETTLVLDKGKGKETTLVLDK